MRKFASAFAIILFSLGVLSAAAQEKAPKTARDYFNQLKAAQGFTGEWDKLVCFRDDNDPEFAVLSRGSDVLEEMKKAGKTPSKVMLETKPFLYVKTYDKGVSDKTHVYEPMGKEGTDWFTEFGTPFQGRKIYSINWATGRYKLSVYALARSENIPASETTGKCDLIHPNAK